ncbi:alanine dehydrogenase [Paraoerskovia sediminicola]|uniref:Alanine dehydrogenase n=1 Tax=Paraoerskovia sediminicola TaxID=1138587 RepID=A0ABM8G6E5_9CELL|nr:alanine dehydrogenase [Paraoerskovia sediminicola]BDZ43699.1 alanine dehydrogenase [Paraoerskovia sediminicola]
MRIGVPTEVKNHEYRVAITPAGAHHLVEGGHEVVVQAGAGLGSAITDEDYAAVGATIVPEATEVWGAADLVCKVKEPVASEYGHLRDDQILFTYLHLAADEAGTKALLDSGTTAVAYETVRARNGSLPLLAPMSEVAGRLATQVGAEHLLKSAGGRGVLLGGVPGTQPGKVVVLGGGTAGRHAAEIAVGLRADVTVLDLSLDALRDIDQHFGGRVRTVASNAYAIEQEVLDADLVIGAVLIAGARAPKLVSTDLVSRMRHGSVLVDIAVDQGGCFEASRPTTHDDPVFEVEGSLFYCVSNMPGAVPVTSTHALTSATLPYLSRLADHGSLAFSDQGIRAGLATHKGALTSPAVADAHGLLATSVDDALRL